jgi:hypothetical protein
MKDFLFLAIRCIICVLLAVGIQYIDIKYSGAENSLFMAIVVIFGVDISELLRNVFQNIYEKLGLVKE